MKPTNPNQINYKKITLIAGLLIIAVALITWLVFDVTSTAPVEQPYEEISPEEEPFVSYKILGKSVENRDIEVYEFGSGATSILLVGGVHGGYEWNSVILAETMIEHFMENPDLIPDNLTVSIIPVLNPDGLAVVTGGQSKNITAQMVTNWNADGQGRFNANAVDLNRNFDCKWQPKASWRNNSTSAGATAFSEPEARVLRDYVQSINPSMVVFWHSVAGNVYASECEAGVLPLTLEAMTAYSTAGNYGAVPIFDAYPVTGDAEGWLASIGIPAITVELETRNSIEWKRNLSGTLAIFDLFITEAR